MCFKDRFEKHFIKPANDCWIWTSGQNRNGYGTLRNQEGKMEVAHRISYRLYRAEMPEGMLVLHKCDVRHCVNPQHLFLGTYKDNNEDMLKKGRGAHWKNDFVGSKNPNSKLSELDKDTIVNDLLGKKHTQKDLAEIFGVYRQAIWRVGTERGLVKKFRKGWVKI